MHSSLRYFLIVVALFAGALFAACSSDGDDNGDADSDEPTAEQPADDDADDADTDSDDDDGDGSGDLSDFAERFGTAKVRVTYAFSGPGFGDEQLEAQMTLYSDPPDRWRTDFASADRGITTIFDGESTVACTTSDGGGICFDAPIGDIGAIPFLNTFTDPDGFDDLLGSSLGVDVAQSSREIAGQDATCFSFSGEVDGTSGSVEYCFRDDGVLLLLRVADPEGDVVFGYEATNVSNSVSDSDFDPPYDVRTIPGLEDFDLDDIPGLDGIPDVP